MKNAMLAAWKALEGRLRTTSCTAYVVFVNGVFVGEISPLDYDRIKSEIRRDYSVWIKQACVTLESALSMIWNFSLVFAGVSFWLFVLTAMYFPIDVVDLFSHVFSADEISRIAHLYVNMCILLLVTYCVAAPMFGVKTSRYVFDEHFHYRVREFLNVAADGDVNIYPKPRKIGAEIQKHC